jgi:NADPH:quinone reductase-like Zn-dependent oxidoreductase
VAAGQDADEVKAVVVHTTGNADVLRLEDVERPEPAEGEVLIRVNAAAVNAIDWKYRRGLVDRPLPAVLGEELSGTVELSRAEEFAPGDEVFGFSRSGAYAEYATAAATAIARKPGRLGHEQAAALAVSGSTAWQALHESGRLERGQVVLVAGAAGGIGHLAVQLAKLAGARVVGTASTRNRDFVLSLGADTFIDYTSAEGTGAVTGVDLALDTVGGATTASLLPTLREGGTLVTIAYPPEAPPQDCRCWVKQLITRPDSEQLAATGDLAASAAIRVDIEARFELADVQRAHVLSESRRSRGKIVLAVSSAHDRQPASWGDRRA